MNHLADYLVSCQHNRVQPEEGKLWDGVMGGTLLGRIHFEMPARRGRKARAVKQEVRAQSVVLPNRQGVQLHK